MSLEKDITAIQVLLEDAFDLSQDPTNTLLIWYYNLSSGQFEYSTTRKSHLHLMQDKNLQIDQSWIKGRVITTRGKVYLVVFLRRFLHNPLTTNSLPDMIHKLQNVFTIPIDYYVDDEGVELKEPK